MRKRLLEGSQELGLTLSEESAGKLLRFGEELLRWNAKINLTSVTEPGEVLEKHLLDSLAVWPEVEGGESLLDVGSGGGFPGIPLKVVFPGLRVTLAEAVGKKVGFLKHATASLGLRPARAVQVRVEGEPEKEGLERCDRVISRAFTDVERWVPLAVRYLQPGGKVVAMVGKVAEEEVLSRVVREAGLKGYSVRRYTLPFSRDPRAAITFE